ncbi:HEAT repeat domain-containing protein [Streptomyces sp. NPDC057011]|uniref:HEAT repeat domain-containing protein n=1 Tax=unclassified Streptomyces TaxID=2593676 RepID=UPI00363EB350
METNGVGTTTEELFAAALDEVRADQAGPDDVAIPCLVALHNRPTRDVFDRATRLLTCEDPLERELGARVLRELGPYDSEGRRPFTEETVDAVTTEMADEPDPWVLRWMISTLGYHQARRTLGTVLGHQAHPAQPVRFAVAAALPLLADPEQTEPQVLEAILRLAEDEDAAVRWYALYALFNETAGVTDGRRTLWAAHLTSRADTRRREELSHLATTLDDGADPALRELLGRATGE